MQIICIFILILTIFKMFIEATVAAIAIALISLIGVVLFGHSGRLVGLERYAVPVAVGVFLSIVLYELIPETIEAAPETGGLVVAFGFISFYILANILHKKFHHLEAEDCDRKGAAMLILIGLVVILGGLVPRSPSRPLAGPADVDMGPEAPGVGEAAS